MKMPRNKLFLVLIFVLLTVALSFPAATSLRRDIYTSGIFRDINENISSLGIRQRRPSHIPKPKLTPSSTPGLSVTPTRPSITPIQSPTPIAGYTVITLNGTTNQKYNARVNNYTIIDATKWISTAIGPSSAGGTTPNGAEIFGTDNTAGGGKYFIWRGGLINGSIPRDWTWSATHSFGGYGITMHNDGPIEWQYVRIHNVEDGLKPKETPEYSNTGSFLVRDSYFTAIRDDVIENDRFESGTIQDSLFDGVYAFYSEQDENVGNNMPIGSSEDPNVYIKRTYIRLHGTNNGEGTGKWFKILGSVPHHFIQVSDSVFATDSVPRLGWSDLKFSSNVIWGSNNYILWLGTPGQYSGPKPSGVTFLEGTSASDKWISVRTNWLINHGLPSQSYTANYDPFVSPLMQIPVVN